MKKTKLLIVLTATVLLTLQSFAQENNIPAPLQPQPDFLKHEIGVSVGAMPLVSGTMATFGAVLNLEYYINFTSRHSLGVSFSTAFLPPRGNTDLMMFNFFSPKEGLAIVIAPQVGYRYTYYRKEDVTVYFSIFLGIMEYIDFKNISVPFLAYQANVFGFSIGQKNRFYLELGYGNKGMLTVGYKFGFNVKP